MPNEGVNIKNITFAHVCVNEKDRGQLANLQLKVSPPQHIMTGYALPPQLSRTINFDARTNYGEDNEDITIVVIQPEPPKINDAHIYTDTDLGVSHQMTGEWCHVSEQEGIREVLWTATNIPSGVTIDPDTGYVHGQITKGGVYTMYVTCTTKWGSDTATLTIGVTHYTYWTTGAAPNCPAIPGYSGYHDHRVTVSLPDRFSAIESIAYRSTKVYGGRSLSILAEGITAKKFDYTYTNATGTTSKRTSTCYTKLRITEHISGGWKRDNTRSILYNNCHFHGRIKISTLPTNELLGPQYYYIDVDCTYDFYEVPNFSYDKHGVIQTYSL